MSTPPVPEPEPEATTPSVWTRPDPYGGPIDNPDPVDLPALIEEILAVDLTDSAPLIRLERLSQLDAALHAIRLATIASLSPTVEADHWAERHVVEELRLAMGVGDRYADALLDQARAVFGGPPAHIGPDLETTDPGPADAEPSETEPTETEPSETGPGDAESGQSKAGEVEGTDPGEPEPRAPFAVMGDLLAAGLTSAAHLRVLAEVTGNVADDPARLATKASSGRVHGRGARGRTSSPRSPPAPAGRRPGTGWSGTGVPCAATCSSSTATNKPAAPRSPTPTAP